VRGRSVAYLAALALWLAGPWPAEPADALRVCADPDNLPFSSAEGSERGLYVELAELVAARMGVSAEFFWWRSYLGKRTVRNTLLADQYDAYFGLPADKDFMAQSVTLTEPFLDVGYAVVGRRPLGLRSLDDLKGRRVAVQFGTSPQILLSSRDGFELTTFRLAEEALAALGRGEVSAAFVWGPTAGYFNKKNFGGAHEVVPVTGQGLEWRAAVGVRRGKDGLKTAIERALAELKPDIARLADKYGFPTGPAIPSEPPTAGRAPPAAERKALAADSAQPTVAEASVADTVRAGRSLFNQYCAHCHAPNAMSPEPSRDLRRLRLRYGERMQEVAFKTVTEGRPTKGMPTWGDSLGPGVIREIVIFLESVQN